MRSVVCSADQFTADSVSSSLERCNLMNLITKVITTETIVKPEVTGETFRSMYTESVKIGDNINQFAAKIGLKPQSVNARLTTIKRGLQERGYGPEAFRQLFPPLMRVKSTGRAKTSGAFIDSLVTSLSVAGSASKAK